MPETVLDQYLAMVAPEQCRLVADLEGAVRGAHPGFDAAVKYKILMFALDRDWRHWVCAVNATSTGACVRFLYGVLLDDPLQVLRPGSSTLMNWDFALEEPVDAAPLGEYVREAVAKYPEFRADAKAISEQAKATAKERERAWRQR